MLYQLEIRAGEGGDDAKLFVRDLMDTYMKYFEKMNWKWQDLSHTEGLSKITVNAKQALELESGGHRIQRVPPTERRGRVHTSTVTVAVLPLALVTVNNQKVIAEDVRTEWFSGTGKGGQHRNKHQNSCRLIHIPTNTVAISQQRKRTQSFALAWAELERRVNEQSQSASTAQTSSLRSNLTGSGMRADKVRTYRFQDDAVKDHRTGKSAKLSQVMRGHIDKLWH